ncbi:urease accessory protein UreD [Streptomyces sp. RS10V-4]|uniref:urease accessory protein UreD n=1 Tax=Streptomyces rhizoryzae TaxID=2932493 RepID=UPI00200617D4|nr:urease accessory protein UreD [Streptomyces rhizoryzae]MCK7626343.1 urease accessory protein UreD [Streptomyces rhizoryzae]
MTRTLPRTDTPQAPALPAGGLRATARITARADAGGTTRLPVLDGGGPFALRHIQSHADQARVCLIGAMHAPLGGDRLRIEATAEAGTSLRVTAAAATVALPGRTGDPATYDVHLTVGEGARLAWLPEPLISAEGSDLRMTTTIDLAPTARLVFREEQILGRSGERTGALRSRLTIRQHGRTLLDQETAYGPGAPGWDSAAVLGGHRAIGQYLVAGPEFDDKPAEVRLLGAAAGGDADRGQGVLAPLGGPMALATAVAPDGLALRRLLDEAAAG